MRRGGERRRVVVFYFRFVLLSFWEGSIQCVSTVNSAAENATNQAIALQKMRDGLGGEFWVRGDLGRAPCCPLVGDFTKYTITTDVYLQTTP